MNRKRRRFSVVLSQKAKFLGMISLGGMLASLFGISLIIIATSLNSDIIAVIGFVLLGAGMFFTIMGANEYSKEYNKCFSNSTYTTVSKDGDGNLYRIVQNGDGDVLEINNIPLSTAILDGEDKNGQ